MLLVSFHIEMGILPACIRQAIVLFVFGLLLFPITSSGQDQSPQIQFNSPSIGQTWISPPLRTHAYFPDSPIYTIQLIDENVQQSPLNEDSRSAPQLAQRFSSVYESSHPWLFLPSEDINPYGSQFNGDRLWKLHQMSRGIQQSITVLEGNSKTYEVNLSAQPSSAVVFTITGQGSDLTLNVTSLTFTPANWDSKQELILSAVDDSDDSDESVTLTLTGDDGTTQSISVTIIDDERTWELVPKEIEEGSRSRGGPIQLVKELGPPSSDVTMTITGHEGTDIELLETSITFLQNEWDQPQSIVLIANSDHDDQYDHVSLTFVADGGGYTGLTYAMDVTIVERARMVSYVDEGRSIMEGFKLVGGSRPERDPIMTFDWDRTSDLIVSPETVTYDPSSWHTCIDEGRWRSCSAREFVTASADSDTDDQDDQVTVKLLVTGPPGGRFIGVNAIWYVNIDDKDDPGIIVNPSSLTITEGDQGTFEVMLSGAPKGDFGGNDVTVNITSERRTSTNPSTLIFTNANWSQPQTVTVQTYHDSDFEDDLETIRLQASGGGFDRERASVEVTIQDDDTPGIEISDSSISITEGGTNTFDVELEGAPNSDVNVTITGYIGTDLDTLASTPRELTFTSSNWDEPQTVTVGAKEDPDFDGENEQLTLTATGVPSKTVFVSVTDNDRAEIIGNTDVVIREGESATIAFSLFSPPTGEVIVTISGYNGTDLAETPPSPIQRTFDATNWNVSQSITLTAAEDEDSLHDDETLTLTATGGGYDGRTLPVNVTIRDDDLISGIDVEEYIEVIEGGSYDLDVKLLTAPPSTVTIMVDGYDGTDLGQIPPNPLSLQFDKTNWDTDQKIILSASEDDDYDDEDVIDLQLTASAVGQDDYIQIVSVTIRDNDDPAITVNPTSLNMHEGDSKDVKVSITSKPLAEMTIQIPPVGDLTARPSELTFTNDANWSNQHTVTLSAATDGDVDNDKETVLFVASGGGYNGVTAQVSVEIIEDLSPPTVLLSVTPNPIVEGNTAQITATLSKAMPTALRVNLNYADIDTEPSDYTPLTSINIAANALSGSGSLRILDDIIAESDEKFRVSIQKPSGVDLGDPSSLVITIEDDGDKPPPVEVILSVDPASVVEGSQVTLTTTIQEALSQDVTIPLIYPPDGATAVITEDYSPLQQLTIAAGQVTQSGIIQTLRDAVIEDPETFTVALGALPSQVVGGRFLSQTITILDQQKPTVSLSVDSNSIEEGEETQVKITLSSPLADDVRIPLDVINGTANSSDYQILSSSSNIEINRGDTEGETTVRAIDDYFIEEHETFTVELGTLPSSVQMGSNSTEVVTIIDNDFPIVNIPTSITILEGDDDKIHISLTSIPSREVEIRITGQEEVDLEVDPSIFMITPDQWSQPNEVVLTAPQDDNVEGEKITLKITANGGEYSDVRHMLLVNIIDDDQATLVVPNSLTIDEGASQSFDVRLAQKPSTDVTVTLSGYHGTDLVLQSSALLTFTVSDWDAPETVQLMALEDSDAEPDDPIQLILDASGGGYDAVQEFVMVTIREKDSARLIVTPTSLEIFEGGSDQFNVYLSSRPQGSVTVSVSGHQNTDVQVSPQSLIFSPTDWQSSKPIYLEAKNDSDGDNDPITLTLSASGGGYDGQQEDVNVIILDRGPPKISIYEGQASEDAGMVRLPLQLSHSIDEVITVQYETADPLEGISAIAGVDYTASRGIVIFDPGGTRGVVQFEIADDSIPEEHENFTVILRSASSNAIIDRNSATATIIDDDGGTPTIAIEDAVTHSDVGVITFQIYLSQPSPHSISVRYRTEDGTATSGKDYAERSGTVTFEPGTIQTSIDVPLLQKQADVEQQMFYVHLESSSLAHVEKSVATAVIQIDTEITQNAMMAFGVRFARTLSVQLTEALQERLHPAGSICSAVQRAETAQLWHTMSDWTPSLAELLSGCRVSKIMARSEGQFGVWGRGAFRRFQGQDDGAMMLRGDVSTAMIGADYRWTTGWMAGLMVAHSQGTGTYQASEGDGAIETGLTGIYPYVSYEASEWEIWMSGGYGWGNAGIQNLNGDLTSRFGAIGFKGNLASKRTSQLRYYGDVLVTDAEVNVTGHRAEVTRVRLGMESATDVQRCSKLRYSSGGQLKNL